MRITINGKAAEFSTVLTVKDILDQGYAEMQEYVTVQVNEEIIPKAQYESTALSAGDVIDFLYYMGGGF